MKNKRIALIAPSRGVNREKLDMVISRLNDIGFLDIVYRDNILKNDLGYWSGSVEERSGNINDYFISEDVDIIWAISGGDTSIEILPYIDYHMIKDSDKIFIGYSDVTAVQLALNKKSGIKTIQFHMPGSIDWISYDEEMPLFMKVINGEGYDIDIDDNQILYDGNEKSVLVGGCLSVICSTLGTDYDIDTDGKILYLEDVNERPQKLYSYLCALELAGKFENIKGLIFSKMKNSGDYLPFLEKFCHRLKSKNIPIIFDIRAGHDDFKIPMVIGGNYIIDTYSKKISFIS